MANESYGSIIHNGVNYSLGDGANSAKKLDLTNIILTGTTNSTGSTITAGTWFYLNGKPCVAKVDIASEATFTKDTNYEEKTVGSALTELNSNNWTIHVNDLTDIDTGLANGYTAPVDGYVVIENNGVAGTDRVYVTDSSGSTAGGYIYHTFTSSTEVVSIFVRKGMIVIKQAELVTGHQLSFRGLYIS